MAGDPVHRRAAVLGKPIAHSLSPVLHRAAYAALGLSGWTYDAVELDERGLAGFVAGLDDTWRGLSLTMPLKRACLDVADEVSELAAQVGAGNTLARLPDGRWRADNTDVGGIVDALRPHWDAGGVADAHRTLSAAPGAAPPIAGVGNSAPVGGVPCSVSASPIGVLGAGATALSALFALRELGATTVRVYARRPEQAADLAARGPALGLTVSVGELARWSAGAEPVLLSTLPADAWDAAPLEWPEPRRSATRLVFDVVYAGWPTPLARAAGAAGATVVGGRDMLVYQAVRQFRQFTGVAAPVDAMFAAVREAG